MSCCCLLSFGSWVVLGGLRGVLGASWGILGGLGGSWRHLGRSWGRLGRSWVGLANSRSFLSQQVALVRANWAPFGGQVGAKMAPKTDENRCQKRSRKKMFLKIVLEPSWVDFGSSWVPSWGHVFDLGGAFKMVFETSPFCKHKVSRGDFGLFLGRFRDPRGSNMVPAEGQKVS